MDFFKDGTLTTKKQVTIDKTNLDPDTPLNSITLTISEALLADGFMGHYDEANTDFSLQTIGEGFYSVDFKGFTSQQISDNSDATCVEDAIQNVNVYVGNQSLNFSSIPVNGIYKYSIVDSIPVVSIAGNDQQNLTPDVYSYGTCDVNTDSITKDDFVTLLGSNTLVITITFYDSDNNVINPVYSQNFTSSQMQDAWDSLGYLFEIDDLKGAAAIGLTYSAIGVTFTADENILFSVYPKDQNIDMATRYEKIAKATVNLNLTGDTNLTLLKGISRNIGITDTNDGLVEPYSLSAGNYEVLLKLNYTFGSENISSIYTILSILFSGKRLSDIQTDSSAFIFNINTANSTTQSITFDASSLLFPVSGEEPPSPVITVNIPADISGIDVYNNMGGIDPTKIAFEEFEWALNSDLSLFLGRYIWKKITNFSGYVESDFTDFKTYFGTAFLQLLCRTSYVMNHIDFTKTPDTNDTGIVYRFILFSQFANLDILTNKASTYWYDPNLFGSINQGVMQVFQNVLAGYSDSDGNLVDEGLYSFSQDNNKSMRDIFYVDDSTIQDTIEGYAKTIIEECGSSDSVSNLSADLTQEEYDAFKNYLLDVKSYISTNLAIDDTRATDYLTKMFEALRRYVNIDGAIHSESRLSTFDLLFVPKYDSLTSTNYNTSLLIEKLNYQSYIMELAGVNYEYFHYYDFVLKEKIFFINGTEILFDLTNLDRSDIKEFSFLNKLFFRSKTEIPGASQDFILEYYDENKNVLSQDNITVTFSELPADSTVTVVTPGEDSDDIYYSYVAEFSVINTGLFAKNVCYFNISFGDAISTNNFAGATFTNCDLFYNNNTESTDDINFAYAASIPSSLLASKSNLKNILVSYINISVDTSSLYGEAYYYYDIAVPKTTADDSNTSFSISFYGYDGSMAYQFINFGTPEKSADGNTYFYRGNFPIQDYFSSYIFEAVFTLFATQSVLQTVGVNFSIFSNQLLLDYIPAIPGDQTFTTAPYTYNTLSIQDGNSSINSTPGNNTFIITSASNTTITLTDPANAMNNYGLNFQDITEDDLVFSTTTNDDDSTKNLVISWSITPDELTKRMKKRLGIFHKLKRKFKLNDTIDGSVTIIRYFSQVSATNLSITIGDDQFTIDSNSDDSEMFLRKCIYLENLEEGDDPGYTAYNYISGKSGAILVPSGNGDDILVASKDDTNIMQNAAGNTTLVGGPGNNIFEIIHNGDVSVSANGRYNQVFVSNKSGTKVIDLSTTSYAKHEITIGGANIENFMISGNDIVSVTEISPLSLEVNFASITDDPDYTIATGYQGYLSVYEGGAGAVSAILLSVNFSKDFNGETVTLFSTRSKDEDTNNIVGIQLDVTQSGTTYNFRFYIQDDTLTTPLMVDTSCEATVDMTTDYLYVYLEIAPDSGSASSSQAKLKISLLDDTTGITISTSESAEFSYFSTTTSQVLSVDGMFFINEDRTTDPVTVGTDQQYTLYDLYESKSVVLTDADLTSIILILNGSNTAPTEDDYTSFSKISPISASYLGGNPQSVVYIGNALLMPSYSFLNTAVYITSGGITMRDLITAIRLTNQSNAGIIYAMKDKKSPILQQGFLTMVNMDSTNGDINKDRMSANGFYVPQETGE